MHHDDYNEHRMHEVQRGRDWLKPAPVRRRTARVPLIVWTVLAVVFAASVSIILG